MMFDSTIEMKDNAMLRHRPDLFDEWDFEKNDELGLDIYKVGKGSEKIVWWLCSKCKSSYEMMINIRFYNAKCPYCTHRKANHTNSVASQRPDLAKQWHPTKNGKVTANDVAIRSGSVGWWLCENGHEWKARVCDRSKYESSCCVICINKKVLKGYNDMATTHPELSNLLANKEDGFKYSYGSKVKVDWKCPTCDEPIKNKSIEMVSTNGLFCPNCSTCMKYPERVMYHFLKEVGIEFSTQETFSWSDNRKYDFYIPTKDCLIETHGEQHFNGGFSSYGGRTLEEEQENDHRKHQLAIDNGINQYIVINCRNSDFNFIKNNIIDSELGRLFDLSKVDWNRVDSKSHRSFNIDILELWNSGMSVKEIAIEVKMDRNTVARILKNYDRLGKCKYDTERGRKKNKDKMNDKLIYQYDTELNLIKVWQGFASITSELGYSAHSIRGCCAGRSATSHGFIWRYEELSN